MTLTSCMYFSFLTLRASLSGHVEIIEQLIDKVKVFNINARILYHFNIMINLIIFFLEVVLFHTSSSPKQKRNRI